jgi:competence protein ComEC
LHPGRPVTGTHADTNNNSLVFKLNYGRTSFLLTGDIEQEAMEKLSNDGDQLASTVLCLPHHGSSNGLYPDFLKHVQPRVAVIQVGEHNRFNHPAPAVLQYWVDQGVPVYRTDRHGAVTVTSDGNNLKVETVLNPEKSKM